MTTENEARAEIERLKVLLADARLGKEATEIRANKLFDEAQQFEQEAREAQAKLRAIAEILEDE